MMLQTIGAELGKSIELYTTIQNDLPLQEEIVAVATVCMQALAAGNKIIFAGNGGSAADAQHLAAELIGRFMGNRISLAAISLTTDTSALTAIGNDFGYDQVFKRQLEGLGKEGDVFFGISTSGKSSNILLALEQAKAQGIITVGLCGKHPNLMKDLCEYLLPVPSTETAKIQEGHITFGHILCRLIEEEMFPNLATSRQEPVVAGV